MFRLFGLNLLEPLGVTIALSKYAAADSSNKRSVGIHQQQVRVDTLIGVEDFLECQFFGFDSSSRIF